MNIKKHDNINIKHDQKSVLQIMTYVASVHQGNSFVQRSASVSLSFRENKVKVF